MSGVADQLIRESRVARATGVTVELVDADHPDCSDFQSDEGGRWVTICTAHNHFVQHETWKLARQNLGHPEDWCPVCQESEPADADRKGFSKAERERALETRKKKAEERKQEKEAKEAKAAAKKDLETQWLDWTVAEPMVDRVYLPGEKELHDEQRQIRAAAKEKARKAKEGLRAAERSIENAGRPKSKREKKNLDRLEEERDALDDEVVAQQDRARIAEAEHDRIARRAFLRGCIAAGWKLNSARPITITKSDRAIRVPDNYLPLDDLPAAKVMPPEEEE